MTQKTPPTKRLTMMSAAMWLLALGVMVLLTGAVPTEGLDATAVFKSLPFMALLACMAMMLILACAKERPSLRWFSFAACHLGIVAILCGGFMGYFWGVKRDLEVLTGQRAVAARYLPSPCRLEHMEGFFEIITPVLSREFGKEFDPAQLVNRFKECNHTPEQRKAIPLGFSVAATDFDIDY